MVNLKKKVAFLIYYRFNENNMWLRCLNATYVITVSILAHHTIPSPTSALGHSADRIVIRG